MANPDIQIGMVIGFEFDWLTLNRVQFTFVTTRVLLPGWIIGHPTSVSVHRRARDPAWNFWPGGEPSHGVVK